MVVAHIPVLHPEEAHLEQHLVSPLAVCLLQ
jgi:hypothetical protein